MGGITAQNGQLVTDEKIATWAGALDSDSWPKGWHNVGDAIDEQLPSRRERRHVEDQTIVGDIQP